MCPYPVKRPEGMDMRLGPVKLEVDDITEMMLCDAIDLGFMLSKSGYNYETTYKQSSSILRSSAYHVAEREAALNTLVGSWATLYKGYHEPLQSVV